MDPVEAERRALLLADSYWLLGKRMGEYWALKGKRRKKARAFILLWVQLLRLAKDLDGETPIPF